MPNYNTLTKKHYQMRPETFQLNKQYISAMITGFKIASLVHMAFLALFLFLRVNMMALVNIISVITYFVCIIITKKGFLTASRVLATFEVLLHAVLAVIFTGWSSGFQYYIFSIVLLLFSSGIKYNGIKTLAGVLLSFLFIGLHFYSRFNEPYNNISVFTLSLLNYTNIICAFVLTTYLAQIYHKAVYITEQKLIRVNKKLERLAGTDPLTRLLNRRQMLREIRQEVDSFRSFGRTFTVIMADIDNFKTFNDIYCHECGDFVLRKVSDTIRKVVGNNGKAARWGGEEFLILLPRTDTEEGRILAEELRERVRTTNCRYMGMDLTITMTYGLAAYKRDWKISECINTADKALRKGKSDGKDRVEAS